MMHFKVILREPGKYRNRCIPKFYYFKVFSALLVYIHAYMCVGEFICLPHCVIYYWLIMGEGHKNFLFQFIVGKTEMQGIGILGP